MDQVDLFLAAQKEWPTLATMVVAATTGVAFALGVIALAAKHPARVLWPWILGAVALPLTVLAVVGRSALDAEISLLRTVPRLCRDGTAGIIDQHLAVGTFSLQVAIGSTLLVMVFLCAGAAASRLLVATGVPHRLAVAPLFAGLALAVLSAGMASRAVQTNDLLTPLLRELPDRLWVLNGELAGTPTWAATSFTLLVAIASVWGMLLCRFWITASPSRSAIAVSGVLIAASALLVGESLPFAREALEGRLPFGGSISILELEPTPPATTGPDQLNLSLEVLATASGFKIGEELALEGIAPALHAKLQQVTDLHHAANDDRDFRKEFQPVFVAESDLTGRRLLPALKEISRSAASLQLAFRVMTTIDRPLLGRLKVPHESGLVLNLTPSEGSTPITFGPDETYDAFARRAVEARRHGPIHLVLPSE